MRFAKYLGVQLVAYAIDMGTFVLLTKGAGIDAIWSNVCAKGAAGICAFFAHRHITFETGDKDDAPGQALRYFMLLGLNIPVSAGLLTLALHVVAPPVLAKFVSDVANVLLTYWASKVLVFRSREASRPG